MTRFLLILSTVLFMATTSQAALVCDVFFQSTVLDDESLSGGRVIVRDDGVRYTKSHVRYYTPAWVKAIDGIRQTIFPNPQQSAIVCVSFLAAVFFAYGAIEAYLRRRRRMERMRTYFHPKIAVFHTGREMRGVNFYW